MAKREKMELSLLSEEIVLFEILPKVPGKSLLRFRCVCKQWRSFLTSSPSFANIHLHHVTTNTNTNTNDEKVVFFLKGSRNFQTLDCHEDGLIAMPPRCYPFQGSNAALLAKPVNGLLLPGSSNMILWNPLTSEYKTIPSPPFDTTLSFYYRCRALGLYHTSSDDDYKILCINVDRDVYIYSLKSNSWRNLESTPYYPEHVAYAAAGGDDNNLLDERLHFLSPLAGRYVIGRLDLKTEKFTKIAFPPSCERAVELNLAVVRGCIQLTMFKLEPDLPNTWIAEMWQMNARGWTKMMSIGYSRYHNLNCLSRRPLYLMRNENK